ncbi:hypothetical protein ROZALSC1DRAFT_24648 [Rozella allomycis CSF55]|uniref:HTH myb-type domain-containing protein n=1 Tax=Rozella allomycis (strain CSF55) TaxID=988480 RepID=A0A4P9YCC5_ROZAC|nr:hypothetical protein ROZALSC1DRAFT_24648 [Rozella allomycis CSF55]
MTKRPKVPWSQKETEDLIHGIMEHGVGNWRKIGDDIKQQYLEGIPDYADMLSTIIGMKPKTQSVAACILQCNGNSLYEVLVINADPIGEDDHNGRCVELLSLEELQEKYGNWKELLYEYWLKDVSSTHILITALRIFTLVQFCKHMEFPDRCWTLYEIENLITGLIRHNYCHRSIYRDETLKFHNRSVNDVKRMKKILLNQAAQFPNSLPGFEKETVVEQLTIPKHVRNLSIIDHRLMFGKGNPSFGLQYRAYELYWSSDEGDDTRVWIRNDCIVNGVNFEKRQDFVNLIENYLILTLQKHEKRELGEEPSSFRKQELHKRERLSFSPPPEESEGTESKKDLEDKIDENDEAGKLEQIERLKPKEITSVVVNEEVLKDSDKAPKEIRKRSKRNLKNQETNEVPIEKVKKSKVMYIN